MLLPRLEVRVTRTWYEWLSGFDRDARVVCMNHGYAALDDEAAGLKLAPEDEDNRYQLQLYDHVAGAIDWIGADAVEVSLGRGGGAAYIVRRYRPRSLVGVDVTARAVTFCRRQYALPGLRFTRGEAECLPFAGGSFDVVLNIEASVYYRAEQRFLGEVMRVLKPDGFFLCADMRRYEEIDAWRAGLAKTGFRLVSEEDITASVVRALALDAERRRRLIEEYVPRVLRPAYRAFAGSKGAGLARGSPSTGERVYLSFVLRRPRDAPGAGCSGGGDVADSTAGRLRWDEATPGPCAS